MFDDPPPKKNPKKICRTKYPLFIIFNEFYHETHNDLVSNYWFNCNSFLWADGQEIEASLKKYDFSNKVHYIQCKKCS